MNKYDNMKNSNLPWIKEIPSHWKITRIKEVLQNVSEKNHPDATVLSLYREYGVLPKDSRDDNHNVTSLDTASYKFVRTGELVINKMKAWQGSLGVSDYEGIVSPAYYVCHFTSDKVNPKYFHYLLRCNAYAQEFERLSTGMRIGQWDLGIDDFMCTSTLIPPLDEQSAIVSYLDEQCAKIDTLLFDAKSSIDEYKKWKASLIFETVTKGLDSKATLKNSGVKWIGKTPQNWNVVKLFLCFNDIGSGTTPKSDIDNYYVGDIHWLQSGDINGGFVADTSKCVSESAIKNCSALRIYSAPYIAIAMYGASIANTSIVTVDSCTNQACCVLSNPKPNIDYNYIFYCIHAAKDELLLSARGGTQPNISQDIIKKLRLPIPSLEEQQQIANWLKTKCTHIDQIILQKQSVIAELEEYKRSLIFEVVTGKRKVV